MKMLSLAAAFTLVAAPACAGPISVSKAWVRPTPKGLSTSAAYFTVTNSGPADVLQSAATPAARASMHMSMKHGDMMMMHPQGDTPVPANGTVTFAPGGLHVMLEGVKQPLAAGQHVPLTLSFAKAGKITVDAEVRATAP